MGFTCRNCGEEHDELPMAFHAEMPQAWMDIPEEDEEERGVLGSDQCEIDEEHFYMRGLVKIPVHGLEETLDWGVWFEMSEESYDRFAEQWGEEGREREPKHAARLATSLPSVLYGETVGVPVQVVTRPVGERPWVEVQGTGPLATAQKNGISQPDLESLWALLLHQDDDDEDSDERE